MTEKATTHMFAIMTDGGVFKYVDDRVDPVTEVQALRDLVTVIHTRLLKNEPLILTPNDETPATTIIRFGDKAVVQVVAWDAWEKRAAEQKSAQRRQDLTMQGIQKQLHSVPGGRSSHGPPVLRRNY